MRPNVRHALVVAMLSAPLAACDTRTTFTGSYLIGPEQALTVVRERIYPWGDEYRRDLIVTAHPRCLVRKALPPEKGAAARLEVHDLGDGSYLLKEAAGAYRVNLADCSLTPERSVQAGELRGVFEADADKGLRFTPAGR